MSRVNADPQLFTRKIMEKQNSPHFMVQKMTPYSGLGDPKPPKGFRGSNADLEGLRCYSM